MASPNTLKIRFIGQKQATLHVTHYQRAGYAPVEKVTRMFPVGRIGKVIHAGGTRVGSFNTSKCD